jgi:hypothetical protein
MIVNSAEPDWFRENDASTDQTFYSPGCDRQATNGQLVTDFNRCVIVYASE